MAGVRENKSIINKVFYEPTEKKSNRKLKSSKYNRVNDKRGDGSVKNIGKREK